LRATLRAPHVPAPVFALVMWQAMLLIEGCDADSLVGVLCTCKRVPAPMAWQAAWAPVTGRRARSNVTAQSLAGVVDAIVKTGDATISTISVRARPARPLAGHSGPSAAHGRWAAALA